MGAGVPKSFRRTLTNDVVRIHAPTQTPEDIDIDALREKYLYERDKRLRAEGSTSIWN